METGRILLEGSENRIGNRLKLIPSKAGGNEDYPGVLRIRSDGIASKFDEIADVGGDDRPPLSRCVNELPSVITLDVADLVRGYDINATFAKDLGDGGG